MATLEQEFAGQAAREYLRVSVDKSGRERSPEEQHTENQAAAKPRKWKLGVPYRDVGSASRYQRKAREGFDGLVTDLEADRFGAKILVMWANNRGSRKVAEWAHLVELLAERKIHVFVTTHNRLYDPTNRHDWRTLMDDAVRSEDESRAISESVSRASAANAAAGLPHGKVPYGYRRIYHETTKAFIRQEPEPAEAAVISELFQRIAKRHAMKAIARDFNSRGLRTRPRLDSNGQLQPARLWTPEHLRSLALSITYAGMRVHDPARWTKGKGRPTGNAKTVKAVWPAIVKMKTYLDVQSILSDPKGRTSRDGSVKHLCSMIVGCAVCGAPLAYNPGPKDKPDPHYRCMGKRAPVSAPNKKPKSGCVRIKAEPLEALVKKQVLGYLSRRDNYSAFVQEPTVELDKVQNELADARKDWDDLAKVSPALAAKMEPPILARIATLEGQEAALQTPVELAGLLSPGEDLAARWEDEDTPITTKRALARAVLSEGLLGRLLIGKATVRGVGMRTPVEARVIFRRPDGDHSLASLGLDNGA